MAKVLNKGPHRIWTGMGRDKADGAPICDWYFKPGIKTRTTAARIMWLLEYGEQIPAGRYLVRTCSEPRCIGVNCVQVSETPNRRRRAIHRNDGGEPVCNKCFSYVFPRDPHPGEKLYCPNCYQIARRSIEAVRNVTIATRTALAIGDTLKPRPERPEPVSKPGHALLAWQYTSLHLYASGTDPETFDDLADGDPRIAQARYALGKWDETHPELDGELPPGLLIPRSEWHPEAHTTVLPTPIRPTVPPVPDNNAESHPDGRLSDEEEAFFASLTTTPV